MKLEVKDLSFKYEKSEVLHNIDLEFENGKLYTIVGKSGSGKTTLLSLMSGIEAYQQGSIVFNEIDLRKINKVKYRRETAIVFQSFNLINYMNAIQNIQVAMRVSKVRATKQAAIDALTKVGIEVSDMYRSCAKLSGGQQQRVAIARAIACNAKIIFADEPTGNLDASTGREIIELLKKMAHEEDKCVICITHSQSLSHQSDKTYKLWKGKLI